MITPVSRRTRKAPKAKAGHVREVRPEMPESDVRESGHSHFRQAIAPAPNPSVESLPGDAGVNSVGANSGRLAGIPAAPPVHADSPERGLAPAPQPGKPASILVADDERRIRLAIRGCLEAEGYTVYEASDGIEALNQVLLHAPDLMILDLAMPNLDGMRTLRELNALHGQLKPRVVMLTAFGSMPAAASAIGLGAAAFAEKPLVPEALRRLVARVLSEPPDANDHLGIPITWPADSQ